MKILIPIKQSNRIDDNPYVSVLCEGLRLYAHEVICSIEEFWNNPTKYDLIFIQWPDVLPSKKQIESQDIEEIEKNIKKIKNKGVKMMVTVHNLHPHNNNQYIKKIYELVYESVDAFHHMGNYSYEKFKKKYANAIHFVVPHAVNFDESIACLDKIEYKKKYGLPLNKPTVIAFGAFRNNDERSMFLDLSRTFFFKCCFWAPSFNRVIGIKRNKLQKIATRIKYRFQGIKMFRGPINNVQAIEMVKASDILFIQRKEILNSGNLPLGFFCGCIVLGPDEGNVGDILRSTGNLTFNPHSKDSIHSAFIKALTMSKGNSNLGLKNAEYAKKNWNKHLIMEKINKNIVSMF